MIVSFLVAGVASACAALSYAEFAGMISKSGSAYTYSYAVLGESVGWIIGWDLLLEYTAIVAVVAIGISGYFGFLVQQVGVNLPRWMLGAPGTGPGHVGRPVRDAAVPAHRVRAHPRCTQRRPRRKCAGLGQSRSRGAHHRRRRVLRENRELHSVPAIRLARSVLRRVHRVFCRLRLRRHEHSRGRIHPGPPDASQSHRDLASDLDDALCAGLPGIDRDDQIHRT